MEKRNEKKNNSSYLETPNNRYRFRMRLTLNWILNAANNGTKEEEIHFSFVTKHYLRRKKNYFRSRRLWKTRKSVFLDA